MPAKKAGGVRDACQESRVHVETFSACIRLFLCPRKPPAGRVGAYRIRPTTRPGIRGEYVFLVFKHRFIVIQIRLCGPSVRGIRDACQVGRGRQGRLPRKPGTCGDILCMYPAFLCPAEASGRQGRGVSHTPSHTPRYMGRIRVPRVQTPFHRHSNTIQTSFKFGPAGRRWGASGMPAKLAGYLKSPYQANFAGVRRRPEGSEGIPAKLAG